MKLSDFTDEEIAAEYSRRAPQMRVEESKSDIRNAKLGPFTYKDVVISYPRKEQFEKTEEYPYPETFFIFFFKQPSGDLIDIYSAISEYDLDDPGPLDICAYSNMSEFIPSGFAEAMEATYEYNRDDAPKDYEGFIKHVISYLKAFGYENFIESRWD